MKTKSKVRPDKGNSLLLFPQDYTVIDTETTGLDPYYDEIIELSAIRVRSGTVCDEFSTLVKPINSIDDFITELTGITNEDVEDAPKIKDILPDFLNFIGNDIIVGHNVNFDINFIYDYSLMCCEKPFTNDFVDTMRISHYVFPDLKHRRLADVASALGINQKQAHRALADCLTTNEILKGLQSSGIDPEEAHRIASRGVRASDITGESGMLQPDNPLFGKVCVFTGTLSITRKEAMQAVANIGGICGDSVTAKTNFLILGNYDYCNSRKFEKSLKQQKAERLILKGQDIQILSESAFFDLIEKGENE